MRLPTLTFGIVCALLPGSASADVTVELDPAAGSDYANQFELGREELQQLIQERLEEAFNTLRPDAYMRSIADAAVFSAKGLGLDYATNPSLFSFGFGGNVTIAVGDEGFDPDGTDPPVAGIAANLAFTLGVNVGRVLRKAPLERLVVYANAFSRGGKFKELDLKLTSFGVHATYKVLMPHRHRGSFFFQWGGLDVSSGLEFGSFKLKLSDTLEKTVRVPTGRGDERADIRMVSRGDLVVNTSTFVIPFEVSSNMRLLYLLTLYGGLGVDIVAGTGKLRIDLDSDLQGTAPNGDTADIGTAHIVATSDNTPSPGRLRFFAGTQLNLWRFRIFAHANLAPDTAFGVAAGARVGW